MLQDIFNDFQQITQWIPNHFEDAAKYMNKAESLIEFLEVEDCGSVGGFDDENPVIPVTGWKLYDRFIALVNKYHFYAQVSKECYFNIESLGEYFTMSGCLREHFNSNQ